MSHSSFIHGSRQSPVVARSSAPASAPALVHFCEVRAMALADVRGARRSFFYSSGTRPAVVASSGAPVSGRAACDSATEALAGPRIRRRPGDGPAARFGETARRANPGSMPPSATGGEAGPSASSTRSLAGEGAWEGLGTASGIQHHGHCDTTYLVLYTVRSRQLGSFATTGAAGVDGR